MKKKLLLRLQSCPDLFRVSFARNTFLLISMFVISLSGFAQGPGCPNVFAGDDVDLDCNETCTDLTASFLQTGETTTYAVSSIPYAPPFPFTGGTPVSVDIDDRWSNAINLPFDFCFYGQTYTQMVIGSNAVVSFDVATNAPNSFCDWSFDETIPNPALFRTTIFGPYMDTNPAVAGSGQINYTVFGDAPCRTMVVNFPEIPYFSCTTSKLTSQIVIYETTNVVEVYIQNRPGGCTWNDGNAVIGIQNQTGLIGESAPGRNTGNWSATNEAWRYTPNGESNVEFSWLDADGNVIGTDTTITVCPTDASTVYTAQAIYTNCNGDVVVETDDVQVNLGGSFDITLELGPDLSFCDVPSYEIVPEIVGDVTGATFLWSPGGETTPTITVTETGTYTLEITKDGCTLTDSVTIIFLTSPDCTIEPECEGVDFNEDFGAGLGRGESPYTNYTFKATGQIDDGEYALVSTSTDLNTGWFADMQDHTGDLNGRMMFVNASIAPDEFYRRTITLAPNTDFTFNAWITTVYDTNSSVCPGNGIPSNVIFRIEDNVGNTIAETNTGDIENGTVPRWFEYSINFNTLNNTDVQLVLINNSGGGCGNDLAIDDITLRHGTIQPVIVTPPDLTACAPAGEAGVFNLEDQIPIVLDGQDPALFNVSFHTTELDAQANTNAITNPSAYENVSDPETIYVRVENVDQPSCFSIVSFELSIEDAVVLTNDLPSEVVICSTDAFPALDATATNTDIDISLVTYEWTDPNGTIVSTNPIYTPTMAGVHTVKLSFPACSETIFTIDVMVNDPPTLDLGPDKVICDGNPFEIIPTIVGDQTGITYLWSTGETTPTILVSDSGTYTLDITVGPCTVSDSIDISIGGPLTLDLGDDETLCTGDTFEIVPEIVGDTTGITYLWSTGETTPTITVSVSGTYILDITVGDCTASDSIDILITDPPLLDLGQDATFCAGTAFEIVPTITGTTTGITYLWSTGETTQTITVTESGTYTLDITVGSCIVSDSITITISDPVVVDLGDDFDSCFDGGTSLTATVEGNPQNVTYEWFLNGILLSGETGQMVPIFEAGEYTVVVTTAEGCTGQDSVVVGFRDNLEVAIDTQDFQTCPDQIHILTAVTSEEGVTYQWLLNGTPIQGATNNTLEISIASGLLGANTYTVIISVGGCTSEASVDVTLYPIGNCIISQGLSPNGDGYNDSLDLTFLNDRTGIKKLQIFNRYGTQVFEQVNYTNQWRGQTSGEKDLPTGTYFYVIDFAGNDEVYGQQHTGWIYLNQKAN